VLGIRDIFGADPVLDPEPDPTPDPIPFFSNFKDAQKKNFPIFFSYDLPEGTLSSVLEI
jgi:hypothetical protein